mmetsp:Transcript_128/g.325  ORF Transcript_128/g.325 Transcript_128/m.325 type:complete len:161 (+) Transcript_128:948-1430(+)
MFRLPQNIIHTSLMPCHNLHQRKIRPNLQHNSYGHDPTITLHCGNNAQSPRQQIISSNVHIWKTPDPGCSPHYLEYQRTEPRTTFCFRLAAENHATCSFSGKLKIYPRQPTSLSSVVTKYNKDAATALLLKGLLVKVRVQALQTTPLDPGYTIRNNLTEN